MKIIISTLLLISTGCMGQWPLQKAYMKDKDYKIFDSAESYTYLNGQWYNNRTGRVEQSEPDTIPVILLVCDTQPINGKTDTHVYWVKGYKVVEDFDTYYLDISKRRFSQSVIVWLDQNL